MPVAKIHVLEGRYDAARLGRVSSAVQQGLISALGVPPDDFFQIIHVLPPTQFRHTRSFLGLNYSDDLILLEITFISGRPKDKRLGLLKALNDGVVSAAKISPDDLLITLYETPGENISFGRGLAQRAHISDKETVASWRFLREVGAGIAVDGLENAPGAFIGMLEGRNFGKLIVRVAG